LHCAADYGQVECIELLLSKGANIDVGCIGYIHFMCLSRFFFNSGTKYLNFQIS